MPLFPLLLAAPHNYTALEDEGKRNAIGSGVESPPSIGAEGAAPLGGGG